MRPVPAYGIRCFRLVHGIPVSLDGHCSLVSGIRLLASSGFLLLGWTGNCSVAAKHAAVAPLGLERFCTGNALIEVQAGVCGHRLLLREPAEGTGEHGLHQYRVHGWLILRALGSWRFKVETVGACKVKCEQNRDIAAFLSMARSTQAIDRFRIAA